MDSGERHGVVQRNPTDEVARRKEVSGLEIQQTLMKAIYA
jgi:hypothetical protein